MNLIRNCFNSVTSLFIILQRHMLLDYCQARRQAWQ